MGDLTVELLKYKDVTAYEIDSELYEYLQDKFCKEIEANRFTLVLGDVVNYWDKHSTLNKGEYNLIANSPYYVATNIILIT